MSPTPRISSAAGKLLETADIQNRLKKIKLLILDIDGIMTDGRVFWLDGHGWTRHFHVKDGYGLKVLMKSGIQVAVISGGDSKDVRTRMEFLKIPYIFLGDEDKIKALEKIIAATNLPTDQMAFMGDDLYDIPVIERVGLRATVPEAEVADAIRKAQGLGPYLT
jgi:3-deoxy-D-manno-octulosonate 8-phosphate phosphatase (KDO 8-P phosphatase)